MGSEQKDALSIFESRNQLQTACSLSLSTHRFGGTAHVIFYHKTSSTSHGHGHVSGICKCSVSIQVYTVDVCLPGCLSPGCVCTQAYLQGEGVLLRHTLVSRGTWAFLQGAGCVGERTCGSVSAPASASWCWTHRSSPAPLRPSSQLSPSLPFSTGKRSSSYKEGKGGMDGKGRAGMVGTSWRSSDPNGHV